MMPMPPTSSEIAAMAVRMVTTMFTMEVIISSISLMLVTMYPSLELSSSCRPFSSTVFASEMLSSLVTVTA